MTRSRNGLFMPKLRQLPTEDLSAQLREPFPPTQRFTICWLPADWKAEGDERQIRIGRNFRGCLHNGETGSTCLVLALLRTETQLCPRRIDGCPSELNCRRPTRASPRNIRQVLCEFRLAARAVCHNKQTAQASAAHMSSSSRPSFGNPDSQLGNASMSPRFALRTFPLWRACFFHHLPQ